MLNATTNDLAGVLSVIPLSGLISRYTDQDKTEYFGLNDFIQNTFILWFCV